MLQFLMFLRFLAWSWGPSAGISRLTFTSCPNSSMRKCEIAPSCTWWTHDSMFAADRAECCSWNIILARCRWLEEDLESEVLSWFVVAHVHGILFFLNSVGQSNSEDVSLSMPGSTCQDVSVVNSSLDSVDGSRWSFLRPTSSLPQRSSSTSSLCLNRGICTTLGYVAFIEYENMIGDAM